MFLTLFIAYPLLPVLRSELPTFLLRTLRCLPYSSNNTFRPIAIIFITQLSPAMYAINITLFHVVISHESPSCIIVFPHSFPPPNTRMQEESKQLSPNHRFQFRAVSCYFDFAIGIPRIAKTSCSVERDVYS